MAVVASHDRKKTRTKIGERGRTVMFVGYADDHTEDVYRFLHIKTGQLVLSRDVKWLNIMWKVYRQKQRRLNQNLEESESDSDSEDDYNEFNDNNKKTDITTEEEEDSITRLKTNCSRKKTWHRHKYERNNRVKYRINKKSNMKIEITI